MHKPKRQRRVGAQNMMGVTDDRFKKGQISFAHKVLLRRII